MRKPDLNPWNSDVNTETLKRWLEEYKQELSTTRMQIRHIENELKLREAKSANT